MANKVVCVLTLTLISLYNVNGTLRYINPLWAH